MIGFKFRGTYNGPIITFIQARLNQGMFDTLDFHLNGVSIQVSGFHCLHYSLHLLFFSFFSFFLRSSFCRFCVVIRLFHPRHNGQ